MSAPPRFIVAEVSKSWPAGEEPDATLIAERFETVIATNLARGYVLRDWKLIATPVRGRRLENGDGRAIEEGSSLVETIVAVFELEASP